VLVVTRGGSLDCEAQEEANARAAVADAFGMKADVSTVFLDCPVLPSPRPVAATSSAGDGAKGLPADQAVGRSRVVYDPALHVY
jgi:hypothetical protein